MKKVLFIDRDGTLIKEPADEQVDSLEKLEFYPKVFRNLYLIQKHLNYQIVMVSNQDGLGSDSYPMDSFNLVHNKFITAFKNEGVVFDNILIDKSFPHENLPTRKPGIGLLTQYINGNFNLDESFVIGDRITDVQMAEKLGANAILIGNDAKLNIVKNFNLNNICKLITDDWDKIYDYLLNLNRIVRVSRNTKESKVEVSINLDGNSISNIKTGINFFDHLLEQIPIHSGCNLSINTIGDLHIDEHHTIEDTAITLGEAINKALGDKKGIERYGYCLPMDDSLSQVAIDFGGRSWIVWNANFTREKIGDMPVEMFYHFFKSLSDAAKCNLNIKAEGNNEHHKIESIFKAFAKALKMAVKKDKTHLFLPSTKDFIQL